MDDDMIAALLRERAGYLARGLRDRVAEVDDQLAARGHPPGERGTDAAAEGREQSGAQAAPPTGRTGRPRRTADAHPKPTTSA